MHKYLTDREITEQLKNLTILIDKREQVNQHLTEYFDKKKIPYIERSMSVGDYSAMLDDMTLEYEITCERKRDIDELAFLAWQLTATALSGNFSGQNATAQRYS